MNLRARKSHRHRSCHLEPRRSLSELNTAFSQGVKSARRGQRCSTIKATRAALIGCFMSLWQQQHADEEPLISRPDLTSGTSEILLGDPPARWLNEDAGLAFLLRSLRLAPIIPFHPVKAVWKLSQVVGDWFLSAWHMCVSVCARDDACTLVCV